MRPTSENNRGPGVDAHEPHQTTTESTANHAKNTNEINDNLTVCAWWWCSACACISACVHHPGCACCGRDGSQLETLTADEALQCLNLARSRRWNDVKAIS